MALTFTTLTKGGSATDATSYATASITPSANRTILAGFSAVDAGAALNVTAALSGNGLTWTQVASAGNTSRKVYVFRASSVSAPTTEALTFSSIVSAGNADGAGWIVVEINGTNIYPNDGIVQSNTGTNATASISITLGSAITGGNASGGFIMAFDPDANPLTITAGTGYTRFDQRQQNVGSETTVIAFLERLDGQTVVDATTEVDANGIRGVALEIARENPQTLNNYQFPTVGDGMSVTEKVK